MSKPGIIHGATKFPKLSRFAKASNFESQPSYDQQLSRFSVLCGHSATKRASRPKPDWMKAVRELKQWQQQHLDVEYFLAGNLQATIWLHKRKTIIKEQSDVPLMVWELAG